MRQHRYRSQRTTSDRQLIFDEFTSEIRSSACTAFEELELELTLDTLRVETLETLKAFETLDAVDTDETFEEAGTLKTTVFVSAVKLALVSGFGDEDGTVERPTIETRRFKHMRHCD